MQSTTTRPYTPLRTHYPATPAYGIRPGYALVLLLVAVVGFVFQQRVVAQTYARETADLVTPETIIEPVYAPKVAQSTDSVQRLKVGHALLAKNMPAFAALNYARASELDPNLREAAYGWAIAVLKSTNGQLTATQRLEVATALDRAEAVDPLYLPVITLKLELAKQFGDTATADALQRRLEAISKS